MTQTTETQVLIPLTTAQEVDEFLKQYPLAAIFKAGTCHKTMQGFGVHTYRFVDAEGAIRDVSAHVQDFVGAALDRLGAEVIDDPRWGSVRRHATLADLPVKDASPEVAERTPLPDWATRPAPVEARPPRPLAPSSLGEDDAGDAPPTPEMQAAAERGTLMHALFERLPAVAPPAREGAADAWLASREVPVADRPAIVAPVLRVLDDPAFADLFGPEALVEAPISAVLPNGRVVSGTVDRLLIGDTRVRVIDYKTGRQVPRDASHLVHRSMSVMWRSLGFATPRGLKLLSRNRIPRMR